MFRNSKRTGRWPAIAVAIGLFCSSQAAWAGKPDKPGGGGGKEPGYSIIQLDDVEGAFTNGVAWDINDTGLVVGKVEDAVSRRTSARVGS